MNYLNNKKYIVGIIGLGYVGVPTAIAIAKNKNKVIGFDINKEKVANINEGVSYISDISSNDLMEVREYLSATTQFEDLAQCDVVIIAVPTPLTKRKTPDTSAIEEAANKITKYYKKGALIILESTTYPGTTEELLLPILEKNGRQVGKDFFLVFAPERIDPGNKNFKTFKVTKIIGALDEVSRKKAAEFYSTFIEKIHCVSSARAAEFTKLYENTFRLINISFVNEMNLLAKTMGISMAEVIEAAKTKPYGFMAFMPGPGAGGHCIPLDPYYLSSKAREFGFITQFINLAGEINDKMPEIVINEISQILNKNEKNISNSKILIIGVAYKKNIDDPRESPALTIINELLELGANVNYHDPYIPKIKINEIEFNSVTLSKELVKANDLVIVLTDHENVEYDLIEKNAQYIFDTRRIIKNENNNVSYLY